MKIKMPNFKNISKKSKIILIFTTSLFVLIFILPALFIGYFFIYISFFGAKQVDNEKFYSLQELKPIPLNRQNDEYIIREEYSDKEVYFLQYRTSDLYSSNTLHQINCEKGNRKIYESYFPISSSDVELSSFLDEKVNINGEFAIYKDENQCIKNKCKKVKNHPEGFRLKIKSISLKK